MTARETRPHLLSSSITAREEDGKPCTSIRADTSVIRETAKSKVSDSRFHCGGASCRFAIRPQLLSLVGVGSGTLWPVCSKLQFDDPQQ
ncbi:unnamed protein product [Amoebophrya sp. A25]|nr:unnamed protein product [Amoebophrya sp. A25]|eukprot:GSA25T00025074001.1